VTEPQLADAGFREHTIATVGGEHAALLAATLDLDPHDHAPEGAALPLPWHWACFLPTVRTDALGPDGHPRRRPEMARFPRRMWIGGRVQELRPLRVGHAAERASTLRSVSLKDGASGRFWLLTVAHTVTQDGDVCIEEEQDLALREASSATAPAPGPAIPEPPGGPDAEWVDERTVDPVLLFRYSALTFNSHRIHYDVEYATGEEGYPGLVAQGPLLATLLCASAREHIEGHVREIAFRARVPVFAPARMWLTGRRTNGGAELAAVRGDGEIAMTLAAAR
jgi:3-methylfumaryl-CoA hydratase